MNKPTDYTNQIINNLQYKWSATTKIVKNQTPQNKKIRFLKTKTGPWFRIRKNTIMYWYAECVECGKGYVVRADKIKGKICKHKPPPNSTISKKKGINTPPTWPTCNCCGATMPRKNFNYVNTDGFSYTCNKCVAGEYNKYSTIPNTHKRCKCCKEIKHQNNFYHLNTQNSRSGYRSICKLCTRIARRLYYGSKKKHFYAYKPTPDGKEPDEFNTDGSPNFNRCTFDLATYRGAQQRARKLYGIGVCLFEYVDFIDRTTWNQVELRPVGW